MMLILRVTPGTHNQAGGRDAFLEIRTSTIDITSVGDAFVKILISTSFPGIFGGAAKRCLQKGNRRKKRIHRTSPGLFVLIDF